MFNLTKLVSRNYGKFGLAAKCFHNQSSSNVLLFRMNKLNLCTRNSNFTNQIKRFLNTVKKDDARNQKIVGSWLMTCSGMVFIAVILGGVTRLTESGLSMVTWKLLGEKMPTSEALWVEEFEKYKQYPEYKISNYDMSLAEFKRIWWMEYAHRMWGRLIGVVFIVPAVYFGAKKMYKPGMQKRVLALGSLIGCQGLMGWYMVKSGLEDNFNGPSDVPRVSQYRLASHLGLAFIIYTGFLYNALDHLLPSQVVQSFSSLGPRAVQPTLNQLKKLKMLTYSTKGLVFVTAMSGAFVAGLDAGLIYNSFPKMAGAWIPGEILTMRPIMKNFTENPTTVQFDHRILGITTVTLISTLGLISFRYKLPKRTCMALATVLSVGYMQIALGITTLLNHVPTALAAMHQSGSLLLLSSMIWLCHEMKYIKKLPK